MYNHQRGRNLPFWIASVFFCVVFITLLKTSVLSVAEEQANNAQQYPARKPVSQPLDIRQRMARSEKSWQTAVQERHRIRQGLPPVEKDENAHSFFPGGRLPDKDGNHVGPYYTVWDYFPPAYTCPWDIQRIGRFGDGGKWICGMSKYEKHEGLIVYSFGVEQDSAFEEAILKRTDAEIFAYDFSVNGFGDQIEAHHKNRTHFHKIGLSGEDKPNEDPPFHTLKTIMEMNGHDYIDILKMDVEGAEFAGLGKFMDDYEGRELPIGQFLVEVHLVNRAVPAGTQQVIDWWERLEAFGMRGTWLEVNLIGVTLASADAPNGFQPRWSEYVFVNTRDRRNILWQED